MKRFLFIVALLLTLSSQIPLWAQSRKEKAAQEEVSAVPELSVNNNNILSIKNAPVGAKLQILTIVGNKVREIEIRSSEESYELHLPKAIYIFKLEGMVRKFVIR
ncbi:MAG: hypothetical protein LBS25_02665 [Candidatus Symbiothrix sp.]|jgi:Leucine-rich repeat (LRR) protein|nr:hypothetical protein [Candidatus Symbiothrix sp.]